MSDVDKIRARLRQAEAVEVEVVVPIDEESVNCLRCGGSGKTHAPEDGARARSMIDCPDCDGSGVRLEGEKAPSRPKTSKKVAEALMDLATKPTKGLCLTLVSDEPPPLALNMEEVDDETKLTGPALLTSKVEYGIETSVRFSEAMFIRSGGMISFGIVHDVEGEIVSVFPLGRVIHMGGEFRATFRIGAAPPLAARRPLLKADGARHSFTTLRTRMSPEDLAKPARVPFPEAPAADWFDKGVMKTAAKRDEAPRPKWCADCGKRLFFRPPSGVDQSRCTKCRDIRTANTKS